MLAEARQCGIVVIQVADYDPRDAAMETALCSRFHLKKAVVIKVSPHLSPEYLRTTLGHFAGPYLVPLLGNARTVAIAGGRTLAEVIRFSKPPESAPGPTFLQAMGQVGVTPDKSDAQELGRSLAAVTHGRCNLLNSPAFLPDIKTRDTIAALGQIDEVLKQLS